MNLRAVQDFNPKQMSKRERKQLTVVLESEGLMARKAGAELVDNLRGGVMIKEEEIELVDNLRGGILVEYLSTTKQIKETYKLQLKEDRRRMGVNYNRPNLNDYEQVPLKTVAFYSFVPAFKKGDTMKTIHPANIG